MSEQKLQFVLRRHRIKAVSVYLLLLGFLFVLNLLFGNPEEQQIFAVAALVASLTLLIVISYLETLISELLTSNEHRRD
ncbi:hypothetical protein KJY73_17655 [Bowmanella sp. Y26]|uniref:Uncharacterized protein n=1 Tax=Bowmanella yangjiangensis TaxID=2811230 RepID=A0ABS3CSM0_9ALTE|nr:hypothetical protein [Bowmanella yangjiangensis]MBN7820117.1 hypothetical protein [Bowmanella yangjiangensis]MBT1065417.1 hypothetical protein [Bowmanella yangjiangensis]